MSDFNKAERLIQCSFKKKDEDERRWRKELFSSWTHVFRKDLTNNFPFYDSISSCF